MTDPTETIRRGMTAALNSEAKRLEETTDDPRAAMEAKYGQVWSTQELQADFRVVGFMAPFVNVIRKSDGVGGLMMFSHSPRFYHSFDPV